MIVAVVLFFFFKQKTAYEMRISDWSSDVCSSDLGGFRQGQVDGAALCSGLQGGAIWRMALSTVTYPAALAVAKSRGLAPREAWCALRKAIAFSRPSSRKARCVIWPCRPT